MTRIKIKEKVDRGTVNPTPRPMSGTDPINCQDKNCLFVIKQIFFNIN